MHFKESFGTAIAGRFPFHNFQIATHICKLKQAYTRHDILASASFNKSQETKMMTGKLVKKNCGWGESYYTPEAQLKTHWLVRVWEDVHDTQISNARVVMTEAAENNDNFRRTTDTKIEDKHTEQKLHNANQVKSNHQLAQAVAEISKGESHFPTVHSQFTRCEIASGFPYPRKFTC